MTVVTGTGLGNRRDGVAVANTLACYTHVHADGTEGWATAILQRAAEYAQTRGAKEQDHVTNVERHATWQK